MEQFDIEKQTKDLQSSTLKAIKGLFPVKTKTGTLKLADVWVDDRLDPGDIQSQLKAKNNDRTWGVPIYGTFELLDEKGKVTQRKDKIRLVTLPKLTPRMSYIINGSEHQITNQLRLRPAGYTVRTGPGGIKGQINLAKGYSGQIELHMKPETGVMRTKIGQANQRLYPILNALGLSDSEMARRWGQDVLDANKNISQSEYDSAIKSFAKSLLKKDYTDTENAARDLRKFILSTEMDPKINKRTLGKPHKNLSAEFLADLGTHVLKTVQGEKEPHDRNALEYKEYTKLTDLIQERLALPEFRNKITRKIQYNISGKDKIEDMIHPAVIGPDIKAVFNLPELHQRPDQLNPIDMWNTASRVTIMGPGGIKSEHQVTDDMRDVHPSHLGYLDPLHTPESSAVGIVYHLPFTVTSKDKTLLTRAINLKTNKLERIDPAKFADSVVAFPGQYNRKTKKWKDPKKVVVLGKGNKTKTVSASDVEYTLESPKQSFSIASNTIPFLETNSGGRALVASKMSEQAVPLKEREKPLVQSRVGGNVTFEDLIGDAFITRAPADGIVSKIDKDSITIRGTDGQARKIQLYNNFPLNSKSFIGSDPKVKKGDTVSKEQIIADTNFTKDGSMALGKNLVTAYMPYKGYNFEDGIVITDTAAKKLTSEHLHLETAQSSDRFDINKRRFIANYPNAYSKSQMEKVDSDGVIKKGTVVQPGDPIIARLRRDEIDPENIVLGKLSRTLIKPWKDDSIHWHGDVPGVVTDVVRHGNKTKVYIKTEEPATIGDKLVGRFGNKGVVGLIIPEGEAPRTKDGTPADIILNPHGIITRINVGQVLENAASKVAEKTGTTYVTDNFSDKNSTQEVKDALAKNGLSDLEELEDPVTGKSLGKINVGKTYIMKLKKQVRSQYSARGAGPGWRYSQHTQEPVKGGEEGSKSLDLLTFYSMLGHGSRANLKEMASIKGTKNDEFWNALKTGSLLPTPKPTFAYNKFISYMKGAGVDIKQDGSKLTLAPMTDKEVENLSNGSIKDPQFVRAKDLEEKPGGLMDKKITGGLRGEKWSHIELAEPIVNPIFEQPVRSLLDMNKRTYSGLMEGRLFVDEEGNFNEEGNGITGGKAFEKLLSQVDKEEKLKEFTEAARKAKAPSALNKANHGIRYVEALKRFKLEPKDAYVLKKVPVLPPIYRPIYALPDGNLHTSSVNYLYRDLGLASQKLKALNKIEYMPEDAKQELRKDIYQGTAAVQGLANPITFYPKTRPVRGIIEEIKGVHGQGSKTGFFQKHVLRREQDLVGRGTIIPEPKLGIDEVGLPEEMAWTVFRPFIIRDLVGQGYKAVDADKQVDERSFIARKALETAMNERPVLLNRAPSLHKFSIMAFKPKIMSGRAIKIPPLVVKGFNADHDGDTMHVHVPIMPKAVTEAQGMVPSKHLFNPGTGNIMVAPSQEAAIGLYFLTKEGKDIKKAFSAVGPLKEALDKKEIGISDMVTLAGKKTSAGRAMVDAVLPEKYQGRNEVLDKKAITNLLKEIAQNDPKDYAKTVHALAELGNEHSYQRGFTVSLDDIDPSLPEKDALFAEAEKKAKKLDDAGIIKLYSDVDEQAKKIIAKNLGQTNNSLYEMVRSGARGNMNQLKQIVSAPVLFEGAGGDPLPIPVTGSFSKGLNMSEYWNSMYGNRRGSVDGKLQTAKPGEFNKDLMATTVKNVIADEDCGTAQGKDFSIDDIDAQDRILASDIVVGSTAVAKAGDVITSNMISKLRSGNVKKIKARSPLSCELPKGTCAKCYGLDTDGRLHAIGDNIGAIAGQSMTEPLTQMVLRSRHHGGVAGGQQLTGYDKIDKLIHMPKTIMGKATLAEKNGKITGIEKSPAGGRNIFIDDVKHFISSGNTPKVKTGMKVKKGDPLSDGIIHPRDLVRLKGMKDAQSYLVDELSNAYKDTGVNLKRKNIEAVVRSISDTTRVLNGGDSPWVFGDVVSYNEAEAFNRSALGKMPLAQAEGKPLFEDHGPVKAGTTVGKKVAKILEGLGYNDVSVGPDPIVHEPFLDGIKQLPMLNKDWMAQMGYGHLVRGIKAGAGEAWTTDIHDYSPIPAFAYGAEFGMGQKGKY